MTGCSVATCQNTSHKPKPDGSKARFFRIPQKPVDIRQMWLKNINRPDFDPGKNSMVCEDHFVDGEPTVYHPVPCVNMGHDTPIYKSNWRVKNTNPHATPRARKRWQQVPKIGSGEVTPSAAKQPRSSLGTHPLSCAPSPFPTGSISTAAGGDKVASVSVLRQISLPSIMVASESSCTTTTSVPPMISFLTHSTSHPRTVPGTCMMSSVSGALLLPVPKSNKLSEPNPTALTPSVITCATSTTKPPVYSLLKNRNTASPVRTQKASEKPNSPSESNTSVSQTVIVSNNSSVSAHGQLNAIQNKDNENSLFEAVPTGTSTQRSYTLKPALSSAVTTVLNTSSNLFTILGSTEKGTLLLKACPENQTSVVSSSTSASNLSPTESSLGTSIGNEPCSTDKTNSADNTNTSSDNISTKRTERVGRTLRNSTSLKKIKDTPVVKEVKPTPKPKIAGRVLRSKPLFNHKQPAVPDTGLGHAGTDSDNDEDEYMSAADTITFLQQKVLSLQNKVKNLEKENEKRPKFGVDDLKQNDAKIRFYTGFPTYANFCEIFEKVLKPRVQKLSTNNKARKQAWSYKYTKKPGPKRAIGLMDEFLLTMMKLRLDFVEEDLAYRFGVHQTTVSRTLMQWLPVLSSFTSLIQMPSKEQIPKTIKEMKKGTTTSRLTISVKEMERLISEHAQPSKPCQQPTREQIPHRQHHLDMQRQHHALSNPTSHGEQQRRRQSNPPCYGEHQNRRQFNPSNYNEQTIRRQQLPCSERHPSNELHLTIRQHSKLPAVEVQTSLEQQPTYTHTALENLVQPSVEEQVSMETHHSSGHQSALEQQVVLDPHSPFGQRPSLEHQPFAGSSLDSLSTSQHSQIEQFHSAELQTAANSLMKETMDLLLNPGGLVT